ncbi:hypothetical protein CC86DRAFT_457115 [Ophiobolus disseminans]|uniref:Methyltransferase type 11 domain-containing protein n=1 Tax=Ophiobolus disseminans TaxID=1469910 RepID=A0A6A6ZTC4_9PLEO|nr:hypothetical protein CC86DRAFT_457115 [Ophiobolus disseminans]
MFPTFDIPPQHAETVGARKARRAKEGENGRRSSTSTSQSSGSTNSATANSAKSRSGDKGGFGWFGKSSKKGVQEISTLKAPKKSQPLKEPEPEILEIEPCPPTAPLPPPSLERELPRRPSNRSNYDSPSPDHFPSPPLRSLPSLPPSSALPPPPSQGPLSPGLLSLPDSSNGRRSQYSSTTSSSNRTAFSNRSVFSSNSHPESTFSEESYDDSRLGSNVQFEAVERGSRTGSRQSDHAAKAAQAPFARALAKMESAGARIIAARLSEEWEGLDDDESYQEVVFEKRLWALTAYQRLTQNKHLQSPAHEILSNSRPADQRRILHLHGSLADGWMLATRYPAATVYTLSSQKTTKTPTSYPAPLNHHSLYVPSLSSATPFPDGYFDSIVSRSVATVLRNDDWARSFFDCMRVLKPGGNIEILTVDAHLSCEGPKLSQWVDETLSNRLEAHGLSRQASDTVLDTMEIVGLENIRRARVALPAHSPKTVARPAPPPSHTFGAAMPVPSPQDSVDASRMMSFLGRHFYQELHGRFLKVERGEEWFWTRRDIREECERYKTKMVLTIACAQKPSGIPGVDGYLDL